jgi:nucleoid DNA-binding protein
VRKVITVALHRGERVRQTGFGTFEPRPHDARPITNPNIGGGDVVVIEPRIAVGFRPSRHLIAAVNRTGE